MQGKRILLGITGGIAAYKIANLIRLFIKAGAEVRCILTPASVDFITPLTAATLSKNEVHIDFWNKETGEWANHVELGLWADAFVIAPLTANSLAKMASGQSDNLLLATYLSAKCPVFVAPAMDLDMYQHPTTKRNLETLSADGITILPAQSGELASGLNGEGRMMEPEDVFGQIEDFFLNKLSLFGKKVLITAGPTYEAIDPVRFIGNHSTGKMGLNIADEFAANGAEVTVVLGPTHLRPKNAKVVVISIRSVSEMLEHVQRIWETVDIGVFAAAVADYRPKTVATEKIKKKEEDLILDMTKNPDVLMWAGNNKKVKQTLIGFALETENEVSNAKGKLKKKNLDMIVLNSLKNPGAGFAHSTNKISIFDKDNNHQEFELKSKEDVAKDIVDYLKKYTNK